MAQSFRVASYNILANSYVNPEWYTHVNAKVLQWDARKLALTERIAGLDSDVICLQEVEEDAFTLLEISLRAKGYAGIYAKKERGKLDGCATFYRQGVLQFISSEAIYYNDGLQEAPRSGHLALLSSFVGERGVIRVAGTHLRWGSKGKPPVKHVGYRQMRELIDNYIKTDSIAYAWIVCGDLNAHSDSPVVKALVDNGFEDAYKGHQQYTSNPNRRAKRIDYIFHTAGLRAIPAKLKEIDDLTPLPAAEEPSDHLAVVATLEVA